MRTRPAFLLSLLAACALAPAPAHAATVAEPGAATSVREYAGTIVFDQRVAATESEPAGYRLAIRRPGEATELLPIARSEDHFQADIGPDSDGQPELIYRRCEDTCDLFVYSLSQPTGERAVTGANDPEHPDVAPTIWRGRIAWARTYGEQRDRQVVVYTKLLTAPRSRPSTRLPGVPRRRCSEDVRRGGACAATVGRSVEDLELYGRNLAQVVSYACDVCSGIRSAELRLVDVERRTAAQVAFQTQGLSGQSLLGPSFAAGRLAWYRGCLGDPAACENGQAYPLRYRISARSYERGTAGPIRVFGFADTGTTLYEATGCAPDVPEGQETPGCRIDEQPAPAYAPTRAPLRRAPSAAATSAAARSPERTAPSM